MNLRAFLSQQNLNLLPNSAADWKVGYQFEWDRPILKTKADITNIYIGNHLYSIANNPDVLTKEERDKIAKDFDTINKKSLVDANLNTINVDKQHDFRAVVSLPNFGIKVKPGFAYKVIKKFSIEGVSYKCLSGDCYSLLQESVLALKRLDKKAYKSICEKAYAEQFWYATKLAVHVEQEYAGKLKAEWAMEGVSIKVDASVEGEGYKKLSVNLKAGCPFAVKVKSLEDLVS
ncbi:MAG: hypothetical protein V4581_06930 [Bacteroidota bacterium]